MTDRKKLPIGIDIFEKLDRSEFYYIDKTGMIEELLQNRSEVNLFTRPRRFGKSLNMSMLKTFFEIGSNPDLFDGLKISENKEICTKYMGQFPVISISLKSVEGLSYQAVYEALKQIEDRDYTARLRDDGMRNIVKYGIACYKKNCKVVLG